MATVAQLEAALMKADAAGDEAAAREIAGEIKRVRASSAPKDKAKPVPKAGRLEAVLSGVERGIKPFADFAERINPLNYILPAEQSSATKKQLSTLAKKSEQTRPNYFAGGKLAGEVAATVPLLGLGGKVISSGGQMLTKVAPRIGPAVNAFGKAFASGGIGVQAPTRTARAALRVAGGSASGAAGAALTGQDVTTGAAFGAGIPIVGSVLKRVGGKAIDLNRLSIVKAGEVIR